MTKVRLTTSLRILPPWFATDGNSRVALNNIISRPHCTGSSQRFIFRLKAALPVLLLLSSGMAMAEESNKLIEPLSVGSMLQVILGLAAVLGIFGGIAFLLKRFSSLRPGSEGKLKIIDALSVGARDRVVLLQVGDSQVLLGLTPGRIQPLHVMDSSTDEPVNSDFAKQLESSMDKDTQGAGEQQ